MNHPFDPGYGEEPFRTLANNYPDSDVYPLDQFPQRHGVHGCVASNL